MASHTLLEICIDSVAGALAAAEGGADRLELCSGLAEGGVTPSLSLVREVVGATSLPVMSMIRPRGGGFDCSATELRIMQSDIELVRDAGVHGVVFGILNKLRQIDVESCCRLLEAARPMSVTFHRAIDVAADVDAALELLIDLGFDRVLTSGQAVTAEAGKNEIARINRLFGDRIVIMPGAGLSADNAELIVRETGVREIHGSASSWSDFVAEPKVEGTPQRRKETDAIMVRSIRGALNG